MADLQTQLALAIRNEDYNLAAQLRDQLTYGCRDALQAQHSPT